MLKLREYNSELDTLTLDCGVCGETITADLSDTQELAYVPEFDSYENLRIFCENCESYHFLNMNIPEDEYSEVELEELLMPFQDIHNRKVLRDIMWAKRPDLKKLDREKLNAERKYILEEWKEKKKEIIKEIQRQIERGSDSNE